MSHSNLFAKREDRDAAQRCSARFISVRIREFTIDDFRFRVQQKKKDKKTSFATQLSTQLHATTIDCQDPNMVIAPTTPRRRTTASSSFSPLSPTLSPTSASRTPATPSFDVQQDMEDPTATPSAYIRSNTASSSKPSPVSEPHVADDSDAEDEAPDYLRLLSTLHPKTKSASNASGIVIPKRGEKDFEPTGFGGQSKLLERSREAMFTAVSGERRVAYRSLVRATWDARTRRARLLDIQGKIFETVGVIQREQVVDKATGKLVTKAWNELLPEEALFLTERGSLQIYHPAEAQPQPNEEEPALVPMSVQQAFAALMQPLSEPDSTIQQDEPLTREAYLIYAHLKRLGYVVQRASIVDAIRAAPISASALAKKNTTNKTQAAQQSSAKANQPVKPKSIIADPQRPIKLTTIFDILLYAPRRIMQLAADGVSALVDWWQWIWRNTMVRMGTWIAALAWRARGTSGRANATATATAPGLGLGLGLGLHNQHQDGRRFLGEKGACIEWNTYDAVFSSLQIVPSGHDFWLPCDSTGDVQTETCSATSTIRLVPGSHSRSSRNELKPFYYAWRPATLYRKSHPPPAEFRIVILNARTTPVPSVWAFETMFAHIPVPGSDQELVGGACSSTTSATEQGGQGVERTMSEHEIRERLEYEKQLKASNQAKNRAAYGKFSQGKQKFLREKAAARQQAAERRKELLKSSSANEWAKRMRHTSVYTMLVRIALLDFTPVKAVARLFRHSPGCWSPPARANRMHAGAKWKSRNTPREGGNGRGSTGNPFPPLKAGRRSVVVAVVDGSVTTLLRFGEAEFAHWSLYGLPHESQTQSHHTP